MLLDFATLSPNQRYNIMTQSIIPRPIAWVLTSNGASKGEDRQEESMQGESTQGDYNLAPFSYFTAVSSDPALVMLSIGKKPDGSLKDTRRNLQERKACVIHIPARSDAQYVTDSAETLAHGESEVDRLSLDLVVESDWSLPRLRHASIAMNCALYDIQEIGPNKQGVIFCEVKALYVSPEVAMEDEKGRVKIDASSVDPLARLGAAEYSNLGDVFKIQRPA